MQPCHFRTFKTFDNYNQQGFCIRQILFLRETSILKCFLKIFFHSHISYRDHLNPSCKKEDKLESKKQNKCLLYWVISATWFAIPWSKFIFKDFLWMAKEHVKKKPFIFSNLRYPMQHCIDLKHYISFQVSMTKAFKTSSLWFSE